MDLKTYNTKGREALFIQITQVLHEIVGGKKATEELIRKAEFNFMIDTKTLIAKSTTDAELNRVRGAMRRAEKFTASERHQPAFAKLSN